MHREVFSSSFCSGYDWRLLHFAIPCVILTLYGLISACFIFQFISYCARGQVSWFFCPNFVNPIKQSGRWTGIKMGSEAGFCLPPLHPSIRIFPTAVNRSFMTAKAQKEGGRGKGKDDVGSSLWNTHRVRDHWSFSSLLADNPATTKSLFHFHVLILISQSVRSVEGVGNGFLWKLRE